MTSKEKLIEFLKSADIEYSIQELGTEIWVITDHAEYYFKSDGVFDSVCSI